MHRKTALNILEAYDHIRPYLRKLESTKELREMCNCCKGYCGEQHNYEECRDKMCFKFYLAFEYLDWCNSFR